MRRELYALVKVYSEMRIVGESSGVIITKFIQVYRFLFSMYYEGRQFMQRESDIDGRVPSLSEFTLSSFIVYTL